MERQCVGTVAQFRDALRRAKHTFLGCECCGYVPVPRQDLVSFAACLKKTKKGTARWTSVEQLPKSIVLMVPGM